MNKKLKIQIYFFAILFILCISTIAGYAQGPGGPAALQNAFAGGPPKPPGGGGGGTPIAVPLDTDALIFLVFAGIVYLLYHNRKIFSGEKSDEPDRISSEDTLITD
jgi:hypothetical protein